ncbi:MAG: ribosome biogenesis GTP-binding protein YihA/YsxC [Thermoanaerobaculia bacterium]
MRNQRARFVRSAPTRKEFLDDGRAEVAFVGRSNVGKSSLLNRLLGRKNLARISSSPGKTRAINYFLIESRFYFVDLPGYGYAKVARSERQSWAKLMEQYFQHVQNRVHVIQLVDGKVGATELDVQASEYLSSLGCGRTVVATKMDRVRPNQRARRLAGIRDQLALQDEPLIAFSAQTGEGVKELWREITLFQELGGEAN